jgi:hypothetical protein
MGTLNRSLAALVLLATCMVYWSHRALRMQYFKHCNRDLIRVVMFDQSVICTNVSSILNIMEIACSQAIKNGAMYLMGALGAVTAAMVTVTARAAPPTYPSRPAAADLVFPHTTKA